MWRFWVIAVVVLLLVSVTSVLVATRLSRDIAVRDAIERGTTFARGVSAPLLDDEVWNGSRRAVARFGSVMENRLREGSIKHIKIWDRTGRVIWADQEVLIGRRFPLEQRVVSLFSTLGAVGEISEPTREENIAERDEGEMLEVYVGATSASGSPVVVESYWSTARIDADATYLTRAVVPLTLGMLLLFAMLVLPLAWSLARRVDRIRDQNSTLLRRSLASSNVERMRIARDLHDGVMQDVSGASYALTAAARSIGEESAPARVLVEEVSELLQRVGTALRSTLVDIYPINLAEDGLSAAVQTLADRARRGGVAVRTDLDALEDASLEVAQLCYRLIHEGLRNVLQHARAEHVDVVATCDGDTARVSIEDDGVGPDGHVPEEGHVGLRLLRDTLADVGGTLEIRPGRDAGTVMVATFPRRLVGSEAAPRR